VGQVCREGLGMVGQVVGYARVSATDQKLDRQVEALGDVDKLFPEKVSGATRERPQLTAMIGWVREGDTVRVRSPDRLGRATLDLLALIEELKDKEIGRAHV